MAGGRSAVGWVLGTKVGAMTAGHGRGTSIKRRRPTGRIVCQEGHVSAVTHPAPTV